MDQKQAELSRDLDKALVGFEEGLKENEAMEFLSKGVKIRSNNFHRLGDAKFNFVSEVRVEDDSAIKNEISQKFEVLTTEGYEGKVVIYDDGEEDLEVLHIEDSNVTKVKLIERFNQKKSELSEAINNIAFEFAFKERSFAERLEGVNTDSLLQASLENEGLKGLKYHYEIRDSEKDSLISGNNLDKDVDKVIDKPLLKSINSVESGVLSFQLMGEDSYLLWSLWPIITATIILSLVMLLTFGYTLQSIFRQKRLSQMKSDFINNMTHEFKTPIATISLALDAIFHPESKADKKEVEKFGDIIRKENERMNRQVESLLQAAQFEKGEINLKMEKLEANELIKELGDLMVESRKAEQAPFIDYNFEAKNHLIISDRMHLFNVFRNLFDNAIKFSTDNAKITVSTKNDNGDLIVEVRDQGIGMSKKTLEHIFDSFYRYTEGNLHQTKGFGLGLSYVKDVIHKMNGEIWAESKLKEGSSFFIRLKSELND